MDYAALAAELAKPQYAAMSDAEAAAAVAALTTTAERDVPTHEARGLLLATGEYGAIELLSRATPSADIPAQIVAVAINTIRTLELTTTLEATRPAYWAAMQAVLTALSAPPPAGAGVLSTETKDALLALRDVAVPVFDPAPTQHDVAHARSL